ncbi:TonB-dependent receptor [Duganella sp. FT94W]|uniref:TonB-dependent receptor n=1 Tax=Duganella lactea TaxID=2692173 RepID=A0ABW9V490_9BURK|nr:TonB-dependent receptor [Duganella lactea]MYM34370.1 TonB-dependent receptor [Duganella lactea]
MKTNTRCQPGFRLNAIARLFSAGSVLGLSCVGTVQAQSAEPAAVAPEQTVVVSASRISGFTAPTPTTMLNSADLERRGATNVAETLNDIPAFRATSTPTGGANGTIQSSGLAGQNLLDLRGLGAIRTLVLVNGRRHVPSNATGSLDLNVIPSSLIERAETVTGGASAAWGSDAVAGVVNLLLKNKLTGMQADVSYGQSERGDATEKRVSIGGGSGFADDRGHVMLGAEYVDSGAVGDYLQRDWGRQEFGILSNPANATNGQPRNIIGPNMHLATQSASGVINAGPLRGTTFDFGPNGSTARPFQYGQTFGASANMFGGEGYGVTNGVNQLLKTPVKRYSVFGRSSYELTDSLSAWVEVSTAGSEATSSNGSPRLNYTIRRDNAYLPASVVQQMTTAGVSSFTLGRYNLDWGKLTADGKNTTSRIALGLNGDLGGGWTWDAYYQTGRSHLDMQQLNNQNLANFNAALDAVNVGGTIVCRNPNLVTTSATGALITAAPGCVPVNILGRGAPSEAALGYFMGTSWFNLTTRQQVAAATLRGEPFSTWAGKVSVATGMEYRQEKADKDSDMVSQLNGWNAGNDKPLHGSYRVKELFLETVVPLATRTAWAKSLNFNGAVRRTDYSTSGPVLTRKLGLTYEPNSQLLLRATQSLDIRAPNINELFSSANFSQSPIIGRDGASRFTPTFTTGNRDLQPERARTTTFGLAYQPSWLPGFKTSIDKYRISISGVITSLGSQQIVNRCLAGATDLCNYVTFNAAGLAGGIPTQVINPQLNLQGFLASGTDLEASYRLKLAALSKDLGGDLNFRVLATHANHFSTIDTVGTVDRAGQTGVGNGVNAGVPKWLWNSEVIYQRDQLSLSAQIRYIPKSIYDVTLIGPDSPNYSPALSNSINDNTVASRTYVNLAAKYDLKVGQYSVQIYGAINNLADRAPPLTPTIYVMTNSTYYDTIGRSFRIGTRVKF